MKIESFQMIYLQKDKPLEEWPTASMVERGQPERLVLIKAVVKDSLPYPMDV